VGFIQDLPEDLRVAFRATLEEIASADVVLHVVDASHPDRARQVETVQRELAALGATDMPVITVFNKVDKLSDGARAATDLAAAALAPGVVISAVQGTGMPALLAAVERLLRERFWRRLTWDKPTPALRAHLAKLGVSVQEPAGEGGRLEAWLTPAQAGRLESGRTGA
jgi:GTP-binding protein HflX